EVRLVRTAQEAEAVLQDLEHAFAIDAAAGARMRLEDQEYDVLLAGAGDAFLDAEAFGEIQKLDRGLALELVQIDQRAIAAAVLGLVVFLVVVLEVLLVAAATTTTTAAAVTAATIAS